MYQKHKKYKKNINKSRGFRGPFEGLSFITFFSCGHGGTRRSNVEIECGKNSKKYTGALKKTLALPIGLVHLREFLRKLFISPW